jgi:hypothetical protein
MPVTHQFHIPGGPDPSRSLLGRLAVRRSGGDPLIGAARYYVLLPFFAAVWFVGISLLWALAGAQSIVLQAAWTTGLAAVSLGGWRPRVCVGVTDEGLRIRRGPGVEVIPFHVIRRVQPVQADAARQHYRRFAETRWMVRPDGHDPILVETPERPWLLSIPPSERESFLSLIASRTNNTVFSTRLVA